MSIINLPCLEKLMAVGLSKYEALAYLALLEHNNAAALDVVTRSGVPQQRIYDILSSLQAKGLCFAKEGRPRSYVAYEPSRALTALFDYRKQQQAAENERHAHIIKELIPTLSQVIPDGKSQAFSPPAQNDEAEARYDIGGL